MKKGNVRSDHSVYTYTFSRISNTLNGHHEWIRYVVLADGCVKDHKYSTLKKLPAGIHLQLSPVSQFVLCSDVSYLIYHMLILAMCRKPKSVRIRF